MNIYLFILVSFKYTPESFSIRMFLHKNILATFFVFKESPVHCMRSLDALMSLAKKKARREALIAIGKKIFDIDIHFFVCFISK